MHSWVRTARGSRPEREAPGTLLSSAPWPSLIPEGGRQSGGGWAGLPAGGLERPASPRLPAPPQTTSWPHNTDFTHWAHTAAICLSAGSARPWPGRAHAGLCQEKEEEAGSRAAAGPCGRHQARGPSRFPSLPPEPHTCEGQLRAMPTCRAAGPGSGCCSQ